MSRHTDQSSVSIRGRYAVPTHDQVRPIYAPQHKRSFHTMLGDPFFPVIVHATRSTGSHLSLPLSSSHVCAPKQGEPKTHIIHPLVELALCKSCVSSRPSGETLTPHPFSVRLFTERREMHSTEVVIRAICWRSSRMATCNGKQKEQMEYYRSSANNIKLTYLLFRPKGGAMSHVIMNGIPTCQV